MNRNEITVQIQYDGETFWLNADNIAIALHAYCPNMKFVVAEVQNEQK